MQASLFLLVLSDFLRCYEFSDKFLCLLVLFVQGLFGLGMSPLMFKNVGLCYKPGFEMYAPMFGSAALSSGFIENLRFYNVKPGPTYQGSEARLYSADKAFEDDYVMELLLLLFPSSAGQLTTEGNAPTFVGNYLTESDVASLYNFVYAVRERLKEQNGSLVNKKEEKKESKKKRGKQNISSEVLDINSFGLNTEDFTKKYSESVEKRFKKNFARNIQRVFTSIAKALEQEWIFYFKEDKESNQAESFKQAFYPPYIVEQILSAFFCHKFGMQDSLRTLLYGLNPAIVDTSKVDAVAGLLDRNNLEQTFEKIDASDLMIGLDDIWLALNRGEFSQIIPYKSDKKVISSGRARMYTREKNELRDDVFSDCTEVTIRHIMNMIFFDSRTKTFDLGRLDSFMEGKNTDFITNLRNFYAEQTPEFVNAGHRTIRSSWNKVVADLPGVVYLKKDNELECGLLNMIRVFNTIFQLDLGEEPQREENKDKEFIDTVKKRFIACFEQVFKGVSPQNHVCSIEFREPHLFDVKINKTHDVAGDIVVRVKDHNGKNLYAFLLEVRSEHTEMKRIKIVQRDLSQITNEQHKVIQNTLDEISSFKNVTGFSLIDNELISESVMPYFIFSQSMYDMNGKLQCLDRLQEIFSDISMDRVHTLVKNIMESYSWDDENALKKMQEKVFGDWKNEKFTEVVNVYIKKLFFGKANMEVLNISKYSGLKELILEECLDLRSIEGTLEDLEILNCSDIGIEKFDVSNFPKLNELKLIRCRNLSLIEGNSESLEALDCAESGIEKIDASIFPKLKSLSLGHCMRLRSVENIEFLEKLNFSGLPFPSFNLKGFPKLKELVLEECLSLRAIEGESDSLEKINCSASLNLTKLDLSRCVNLKEVSCDNSRNLQEIILSEKHPIDLIQELQKNVPAK